MSSPLVASAAGLIKALKPSISVDEIVRLFQKTARAVPGKKVGLLDVCTALALHTGTNGSVCDGSRVISIGDTSSSDSTLCGN